MGRIAETARVIDFYRDARQRFDHYFLAKPSCHGVPQAAMLYAGHIAELVFAQGHLVQIDSPVSSECDLRLLSRAPRGASSELPGA